MKRWIAITLLAVHLFNTAGYALVFKYFIHRSDAHLIQKLDAKNYNEQDLIVLKTPINLPYYNATGEVERVNGTIELDGVHYNYVKRKISNDTLYLYCIPNNDKTKLAKAQTEFSKSAGDNATDAKKDGAASLKKFNWGSEYNHTIAQYSFASSETARPLKSSFWLHPTPTPFIPTPYKPPKQA